VFGNRIGKVPHHRARLGVAKHMAAVHLEHHALDTTRQISLPVFAFGGFLLSLGQVSPPAQLFQQHVVKLGVASGDVGTE